eukprot:13561800-Alexandrium_andersonii.AAC.1
MSASLVGSEMCIRDRLSCVFGLPRLSCSLHSFWAAGGAADGSNRRACTCLLYTSDAADDM